MSTARLHQAAYAGDTSAVNALLAEGLDIDERSPRGETALLFAVSQGQTGTVQSLLNAGANVNLLPNEGESPLRYAVRYGHAEIIRLLLERGADPAAVVRRSAAAETAYREQLQAQLKERRQALHAVGVIPSPNSSFELGIQRALKEASEVALPAPNPHATVLQLALKSGSAETLDVLLAARYLPPSTDPLSHALLDSALFVKNSFEVMRLLLQYGVDPNGDPDSFSPLMMVARAGDVEQARLLIDAGARTETGPKQPNILSIAAMRGRREMVTFLLEQNIGVEDVVGIQTPMTPPEIQELFAEKRGLVWWDAVRQGDLKAVQSALDAGANVRVADYAQGTALLLATERGNLPMMRLLMDAGADPNRGSHFTSPIHTAATRGDADAIRLLLEHGVNVDLPGRQGQTPLSLAASHNKPETADVLIAGSAVLNIVEAIRLQRHDVVEEFLARDDAATFVSPAGETPLHAAVKVQDRALIERLLDRGADINASHGDHTPTPLDIAVCEGNHVIVNLLLDRGANVNGKTGRSLSPLDMAAGLWNAPMVRLLGERGAPLDKPDLMNHLFFEYRINQRRTRKWEKSRWDDIDNLWETTRVLVELGIDLNVVNFDGNFLLNNLIEFGAPLELIRFAIDKGAIVHPQEILRQEPLLVAVEKERADIVEILLASGADPNAGLFIRSPLQIATEKNLLPIVALLKQQGASEDIRAEMVAQLGEKWRALLRSPIAHSTPLEKVFANRESIE